MDGVLDSNTFHMGMKRRSDNTYRSSTEETYLTEYNNSLADMENKTRNATIYMNASTDPPKLIKRDEELAKIEIAVMGGILFLALFGNIIVLIVLKTRKTKLTRMQWFIVHLCLADLFVALFNVLPQLANDITYRFYGNNFLCKMVKFTQVYAMYASSYVMIVCAIDRYMSICYPLMSHTWSMRRAHLMVLLAWVISGMFSMPHLFMYSYIEVNPNIYDCVEQLINDGEWKIKTYITWSFLSVYGIPLIILTCVYGRICYVVWMNVDSRETSKKREQKKYSSISVSFRKDHLSNGSTCSFTTNPRKHSKSSSRSKIKTVKLTLMVVLCFFVCWGPFYVLQMWAAYDETAPYTSHVGTIILLLASLNSCTNPWIYLGFSGNICCNRKRRNLSRRGGTMVTSMDSDVRCRNSYCIHDSSHATRLLETDVIKGHA